VAWANPNDRRIDDDDDSSDRVVVTQAGQTTKRRRHPHRYGVRSPRVELGPIGFTDHNREPRRQRALCGVTVVEGRLQHQCAAVFVLADGERAEQPQRVDGDIGLGSRRA
jgi:hypothetical protein